MHFIQTLSSALLFSAASASVVPLRQRELEKFAPRSESLYAGKQPMNLNPMPMPVRSRRRATASNDDYKLSMGETWYWNMNGSSTPLAKADCSFTTNDGKQPWSGRTVALEKIMNDIGNVECSSDSIELKWSDSSAFNAAKSNWDWVNNNSKNYIAMVVKSPKCAGGQRQVYKVSSCKADAGTMSMSMDAKPVDFADAFPHIDFKLSTQGLDTNARRGLDKRVSAQTNIPVAKDFSGTNIFTQNVADNLDVSLTCGNCKTTGSFDLDFEGSIDVGGIFTSDPAITATVSIVPKGVSATIGLDLVVSAALTTEFDKSVTFLNVPLLENPLSVAGVANIGPTLMVNLDAKIDSVTAEVDLNLGSVTLSIPDDSKATVDIFGDKDSNNGFTPTFSTEGPSVNAGISASASLGPNIVLGLEATVLGKGLAAGLALAAPQLSATASFGTDSDCAGVEFEADLNAQLNAFGGAGNVADVAAESTISLIGTSTQIFSTCITLPTDAATAPAAAPAQPTQTGNGAFGGTAGTVLSDAGCQQALNNPGAVAPALCAKDGGDATVTIPIDGFANVCCPMGTGDIDVQGSKCCA